MRKPALHPGCDCHDCTEKCMPGRAGHFIGAKDCRFHMHHGAGRYCVSTVGDYHPSGQIEAEEIGLDRKYETMVFDKRAKSSRWEGVGFGAYNTPMEATLGHVRMLDKYKRIAAKERRS